MQMPGAIHKLGYFVKIVLFAAPLIMLPQVAYALGSPILRYPSVASVRIMLPKPSVMVTIS